MANDNDLIFRSRGMEKYSAPETRNPEPRTRNPGSGGAWWSIPLLCVGLSVIAWCVLIPASNSNRKLVLEKEKLQRDLEAVDKQIAVNDEFLKRVSSDPELAERLAQRQMKFIREGTNVLDLPKQSAQRDQMSPFLLTAMPRPAPLAQVAPRSGLLGKLDSDSKLQLYVIGFGLFLLAVGLVMGGAVSQTQKSSN